MEGRTPAGVFIPSLLSRLLDHDASVQSLSDFEHLKQEILINIEFILNSRSRPSLRDLMNDPKLHFSVLGMGIDDFCGRQNSRDTVDRICDEIRALIVHFEPRLDPENLRVTLKNDEQGGKSDLLMEIQARVRVKPFDGNFFCSFVLDLETGIPSLKSRSAA